MAYSIANAIKSLETPPQHLLLVYDVICQRFKRLNKLIDECPELAVLSQTAITPAVGAFHLAEHIDSCFSQFSLNFIQDAGQLGGEIVETLWTPLNKLKASTRVMSQPHRHEVLDFHLFDSNLKKLLGIVDSVCGKWKSSLQGESTTHLALQELTGQFSMEQIEAWESLYKDAMSKRGENLRVFEVPRSKCESMHSFIWSHGGLMVCQYHHRQKSACIWLKTRKHN
jgi:hypothetical protein